MNEHDDEDTWTGSLIPAALTDAIQQSEDEQEAAAAALAQLADGPSVQECAQADASHWTQKYAGEGT